MSEFIPDRDCVVAVAAHEEMRVIGADGARPNRVTDGSHHFSKRVSKGLPLRGIEPDGIEVQKRVSAPIKVAQFVARRLNGFTTVMNRSEIFELGIANLFRSASADVVG